MKKLEQRKNVQDEVVTVSTCEFQMYSKHMELLRQLTGLTAEKCTM